MKTTLPRLLFWVLKKNTFHLFPLAVLVLIAFSATAQSVTTGKSYINITRPNGGTFLPGDIIEVRATIAVTGGSNNRTSTRVNSIRYNDTINLAKFIYIAGSLNVLNNEGRSQRPGGVGFTEGADSDSANLNLVNGRLRFNIGNGSTGANVATQGTGTTGGGSLWGALRPTFYNSTCIRMYVYRVQINPNASVVDIDSTIMLSAGNFRYRIGSSTSDVSSNFSPYFIKIAPDYGLCTNSIGANAILGESGGTFGSGTAQNKTGGTSFVPPPYSFKTFGTGTPNDNFYGLANRTSADGSTNGNISNPNSARVFNVWDIIGDHTGAADPAQGNPPTNKGYTLVINASYETNRAFTQNISNLCENTYYEFSAWFRNICPYCGCDSSGKGAMSANYKAGPGGDSSGVRPNLSFQIDGIEYYTSGNIPYTGLWVKKGFVFKTKPGQNAMTVTIRNNAPGGGGNDWAIDDIAVATCTPSMSYTPSVNPNVCNNNPLTIFNTVQSYFDNYTYYKWQRSTDDGATWSDISAPVGPITPTWNGSAWEYTSSYTVPNTETYPENAGDKYRLITATSADNLSDVNCSSTDATNIVTLNVIVCGPILSVKFLSFNGNVNNGRAALQWTTSGEDEILYYDVEKSPDGRNFSKIGTITARKLPGSNNYTFSDPDAIANRAYYRIRTRTSDERNSYSRILELSSRSEPFAFATVVNPFNSILYFDISSEKAGMIRAELIDQLGKPVKKKLIDIRVGNNLLSFDNTGDLAAGMYILKAELNGKVIYKKVMKQN